MTTLTFHFDYLSPYSFLAWTWIRRLCADNGLELALEPTILGVLLEHHGQLGPAEIPAKRAFMFKDVLRLANEADVAVEMPAVHPFKSVYALRVSTVCVAGDRQIEVVDALFRAAWQQSRDISAPEVIVDVLTQAGLPGDDLVRRSHDADAKSDLRASMQRAIQKGVFGVPTFDIDGELFWGNDQRRWISSFLGGHAGYDDAQYRRFVDAPFGHRRK